MRCVNTYFESGDHSTMAFGGGPGGPASGCPSLTANARAAAPVMLTPAVDSTGAPYPKAGCASVVSAKRVWPSEERIHRLPLSMKASQRPSGEATASGSVAGIGVSAHSARAVEQLKVLPSAEKRILPAPISS